MKKLLVSLFLLVSTFSFSQKTYDFDIPWRAKSNEGVLDWFIEKLDSTSDSLVCEIFKSIGVDTSNIQWIYPTNEFYTLHKNGWDYYSRKAYIVNNKDKNVRIIQKNISENKLPNSLFNLDYYYEDGVTTLILVEYY